MNEADMLLGWFGPLGLISAVLAVAALLLWPPGFWALVGISVVMSLWSFWRLKRAPRVEFPNLSPAAQNLLERYNHAWYAPGLTRGFSFFLGIGQFICIGTGIYFAVRTEWIEFAILFVVFNLFTYFAGTVNPQLYMRRHGLSAESHEIATAYVESYKRKSGRHSAAHAREG